MSASGFVPSTDGVIISITTAPYFTCRMEAMFTHRCSPRSPSYLFQSPGSRETTSVEYSNCLISILFSGVGLSCAKEIGPTGSESPRMIENILLSFTFFLLSRLPLPQVRALTDRHLSAPGGCEDQSTPGHPRGPSNLSLISQLSKAFIDSERWLPPTPQ